MGSKFGFRMPNMKMSSNSSISQLSSKLTDACSKFGISPPSYDLNINSVNLPDVNVPSFNNITEASAKSYASKMPKLDISDVPEVADLNFNSIGEIQDMSSLGLDSLINE